MIRSSPDRSDPRDELLRRLGVNPDRPPPPPHTRIDIEETDVPEDVRGAVSVTFGDPETRVSVKIDGITADAASGIRDLFMQQKWTTRDAIMHGLTTLGQ